MNQPDSLSRRLPFIGGSLLVLLWSIALGDVLSGAPAGTGGTNKFSEIRVFNLAGVPVNPFHETNASAFVFIFVSVDCPISNSYAPEFRRLNAEFSPKGIRFKLIYPGSDDSSAAIKRHLLDYDSPWEGLRDPRHDLVNLTRARVTPEAAIFVPPRRLVYLGPIDNRYADFGKARPEATTHELKDALTAILHGKPVKTPSARAVGCYIPALP